MPRYKVYARRITDIETVVTADNEDDALDKAENIDADDRRWLTYPGCSALDTNSHGCGVKLIPEGEE